MAIFTTASIFKSKFIFIYVSQLPLTLPAVISFLIVLSLDCGSLNTYICLHMLKYIQITYVCKYLFDIEVKQTGIIGIITDVVPFSIRMKYLLGFGGGWVLGNGWFS